MNSHAAGPRFATPGKGRRRRHAERVEWLAVIDDLDFDGIAVRCQANGDLVRAALGPRILDDIADDLIESDLELHQRPVWNAIVRAEALEGVACDPKPRQLVWNGDAHGSFAK